MCCCYVRANSNFFLLNLYLIVKKQQQQKNLFGANVSVELEIRKNKLFAKKIKLVLLNIFSALIKLNFMVSGFLLLLLLKKIVKI